jgi:hypothetical protein
MSNWKSLRAGLSIRMKCNMEHKNKRRKGNIGNQNNARVRKILSIKAKQDTKIKNLKLNF